MRADGLGTDDTRTRPGWFRLAYVVVVVELFAFVAIITTPGRTTGTRVTGDQQLAMVSTNQPAPPFSARRPAPTTTAPPAPPPPPPPATTVPPAPVTTTPPVHPAPKPPPSPPPAHTAAATATHGILPPANPPANIAPKPNFLTACSGTTEDDSSGCVTTTVAAIDNGRGAEGLPGMTLPSNWNALTAQEQLYVATNLERTVRGLPPLTSMASALDQAAAEGAASGSDPSPPAGFPFSRWGSNWAGGVGNPLEAVYYWMYDDGPGSTNAECTPGNDSGCWGHRDVILLSLSCAPCVMGTGFAAHAWGGQPSWAELLVATSGSPAADFTWEQETPYLS